MINYQSKFRMREVQDDENDNINRYFSRVAIRNTTNQNKQKGGYHGKILRPQKKYKGRTNSLNL